MQKGVQNAQNIPSDNSLNERQEMFYAEVSSNFDRRERRLNKMNGMEEKWSALAEYIGGEQGEKIVSAMKELYGAFGREMVAWQAELYSPECGGFYFSNSARDNDSILYKGVEHKLLPDVESTIAAFGFIESAGISGATTAKEFLPKWLRVKVADFVYSLQDEDGYFYHPQWGKDIHDLRKTRDYGTCVRLLRLDDREPKYPLPTVQASEKFEDFDASKIPERFRSVENFKKYLDEEMDFINRAYASASVLSSGLGELINYGKMLGCDLVELVIERLNRDQRPDTGFWTDTVDYSGTNAVHKISKIYSWTGHDMPNIDKTIENTMKVLASPDDPDSCVAIMNPWHVLGELISIKRRLSGASEEELSEIMSKVYGFIPEAIRLTAEKIKLYKKDDGGIGVQKECGQGSAYGSITSAGANESNINGNACGSSALIDGVYFGLGIPKELKVPLFGSDALDEFIGIIEKNERAWRERNGISTADMDE